MLTPKFTQQKFLSLKKASQHKKIAERLKCLYHSFSLEAYLEILQLEKWMGLNWTKDPIPSHLSNCFHKHWRETGLGLSEHALLVKTEDRNEPLGDWLPYVFYLDHLRSAENIGSILRSVEAFRLGKVAFSKDMPTREHPKVQKTSMGTFKEILVFDEAFENLPRPWVGVETHHQAQSLKQFECPSSGTFFFGNEEYGLSPKLLDQMDLLVEIPLMGCKNSLNVAACFSLIAWEIRKNH